MPILQVETRIRASAQACFDASRNIDLHMASTPGSNEKAIGGVTSGLISLHEEVTWDATHFGVRQQLTSRITEFNPPHHFRDTMVRGIFAHFEHDHYFYEQQDGSTLMVDTFDYASPLGALGRLADWLFLKNYLQRFLAQRGRLLKEHLEALADNSVP
ncbi:MAG: SRPBCC family protein [Bryobacter sp.]|nr:SRPBCC family protein [Bryobacter sp.]